MASPLGKRNVSVELTVLAAMVTVETTVLPGTGKLVGHPVGTLVPKNSSSL